MIITNFDDAVSFFVCDLVVTFTVNRLFCLRHGFHTVFRHISFLSHEHSRQLS